VNFLWRAVVFTIATLLPALPATAELLPRSVLILDQLNSLGPFSITLTSAFRSTLNDGATNPIAVYAEHLDYTRFGGPGYEDLLLSYLMKKYREHPIGIIVATGAFALEFALHLRSELGSNVPVVFGVVDKDSSALANLPPNVTGTTIRLNLSDAVMAARALVPHLKRIALVGDRLEHQSYYRVFKEEIPLFSNELEFLDLTGLPMPELKERVATLPGDTAIVYTPITTDGGGTGYLPPDALAIVASVANRPIVISQENFLGRGGAGGFVLLPGSIGQEAARLALRIFDGESASKIPITQGDFSRPVFDWRELQRWQISKARLPPGSEVRFRPASLWREYRWQLIAVGVVLLTQAALILGLLFEQRARRRAQHEIEHSLAFERLLAEISASMMGAVHHDANGAITRGLQTIAEFLGADRIALWMAAGGTQFEPTHTWIANSGVVPPTLLPGDRLPWIFARATQGNVVNLADVDEMLPGSVSDRRVLRRLGIKSLLMVPLAPNDQTMGAISLDTVSGARVWPEAQIPRLRLVGEIFGSMLVRQRAAEQVGEAKFETGQFRDRLAHLVRIRTAGEMSVAIAHEINQPLVAIKNYAIAARRRLPTGGAYETAKLEELIDKIGTQASRAGEVINTLRAMVKMHPSEMSMIDVGQLVADSLRLVQMENRTANIRFEVVITPDVMPILGDAIQIQQVVLNLAHNAIEAIEDAGISDGVIQVGVGGNAESEVLVSVTDSGPGIAPDELEHVFEPFYSTKTLGLGIGLSISRSIVEAHGGRLSVASNAGKGSVFQFTLPVANEGD
jgi:signal transduction histidine kinase/ABC-type uncharacterized transport system substrate-binding protein